ncbi:tetratricopeptide repeat-containing sulfotransferase family protein [Microbulbifer sp. 2201CG32-9]|uniref:tetratricopeptide repeat-containing sulfotransferase family protein n=1 Tax=Microbulbifer sp. 2201CG32-9 TaxID=3232309 RepID=UPI00345BCE28
MKAFSQRIKHLASINSWPEILQTYQNSGVIPGQDPESDFYLGLANLFLGNIDTAENLFQKTTQHDANRYDATLFLARCKLEQRRNDLAFAFAKGCSVPVEDPYFLDMAGTVFSHVGRPDIALPYLEKASTIDSSSTSVLSNFAICNLHLGNIDTARTLFSKIITQEPHNQRCHWQLSKITTATDYSHIKNMKGIIQKRKLKPEHCVFYNYAIGKEFEDLKEWDLAFKHYDLAASTVNKHLNYDVALDEKLVDELITANYQSNTVGRQTQLQESGQDNEGCIFITGLPRSGTSLVDQILSSHSEISSAGELQTIENCIQESRLTRQLSGRDIIEYSEESVSNLAGIYKDRTRYLRTDKRWMIDKLPHNYLYLGIIAKSFPEAKIVHVNREAKDSCFAMFKQLFASKYMFSYSQKSLARYYIAYSKLMDFWRQELGNRLIEVHYEKLVSEPEQEIKKLFKKLVLPFETACLTPHKTKRAVMTASSRQVRQPIHQSSIRKHQNFKQHLTILYQTLNNEKA